MALARWVFSVDARRLSRTERAYARLAAGLTVEELRHLEAHALPVLLAVLAGRLPYAAWDGWEIGADGRLYAPGARDGASPEDVAALPWWRQLVAYWRGKRPATLARAA